MTSLTASLSSPLIGSGAQRLGPLRRRLPVPQLLDADCEPCGGPGWFDSSFDLQRGLEVCEGLPADAKLHEWIAVCLRN